MGMLDDGSTDRAIMEVTGVRRGPMGTAPQLVCSGPGAGAEFVAGLPGEQAHLLAHEFHGDRTRYSETCGVIEAILAWTGARIADIRVVTCQPDIAVEIVLERGPDCEVVRANLGDAALLAWRLDIPISVPAGLIDPGRRGSQEGAIDDFRRFLDGVLPEEFADTVRGP